MDATPALPAQTETDARPPPLYFPRIHPTLLNEANRLVQEAIVVVSAQDETALRRLVPQLRRTKRRLCGAMGNFRSRLRPFGRTTRAQARALCILTMMEGEARAPLLASLARLGEHELMLRAVDLCQRDVVETRGVLFVLMIEHRRAMDEVQRRTRAYLSTLPRAELDRMDVPALIKRDLPQYAGEEIPDDPPEPGP